MTSTKQAFGQFVIAKRQTAGLTQRQLADRLHVTESAVSKWERGVSYPDITLVAALSGALGVSEGELINAGDDADTREVERDARSYRRWRAALLWTTLIAYGAAVVTCLVVNLSVNHGLTWFWVVLAAVALAFSLTSLPLLPIRHAGWWTLGASVASLFVLLGVVRLTYSSGDWLPIPIAAVLFAVLLVFVPTWLRALPAPWGRHRTVIALGLDTVALVLFLLLVLTVAGRPEQWATPTLPIVAYALLLPWGIALIVRYLPLAGLYRAAIATAFGGIVGFGVRPLVGWFLDAEPQATDLGVWRGATIGGNVSLLVLLAAVLVAIVLAVIAAARRR